jgi:hypothetical protein
MKKNRSKKSKIPVGRVIRRSVFSYTRKTKNIKSDISETLILDDPLRRQVETTRDQGEKDISTSKLRLRALEHARKMPVLYDSFFSPPGEDYKYSQIAVPGKSNWLQIGPTAVPDGQTASSYYDWANLPALVTGRITSIVIDPDDANTIYVGSALGGVWKTKDGGRNWISTSDYAPSLGIGALVIDPNNCNILYAGTGEGNIAPEKELIGLTHPDNYYGYGILKTTDAGENWTLISKVNNPFIGSSFFRLAVGPFDSSRIFAATADGLFRSVDAGETWMRMDKGLPTCSNDKIASTDIIVHPANRDIAYTAFRRKDHKDEASAGVYRTENANDTNVFWKKLKVNGDFDPSSITRISLTISKTDPNTLYALMASRDIVDRFYRLEDKGDTVSWQRIPLPGNGNTWERDSIGGQGQYNMNIAVDQRNSNTVYLSGISLWKAIRDNNTDTWNIRDIGMPIHPDHHAFAFDPNDRYVIFAGSDGGIYKSSNGGENWSDTLNEGLCITQFEFMDQHPTSDAVIFGGTQDNGTLQYRGTPVFYYSDYGDGGFVSIDKNNPNNIIHQYTYSSLYHSREAGQIDSWNPISVLDKRGKEPPCLFYAPLTLDQENPKNIAFGSNRIFLDTDQGYKQWKIKGHENSIELRLDPKTGEKPAELVSAINFVNARLIYAATTYGKVYRITKNRAGWDDAVRIDDPNRLPPLYIWDIVNMPNDQNTIIIIMAGYGSEKEPSSHIWRGTLSNDNSNSFEWKDISGDGIGKLPSTSINAIVVDDKPPNYIYVGTDIGVFRTSNKDKTWIRFSENLPISSVYDMRLHTQSRLLRIATHGRGMWERQLNIESYNDVNLFLRNHIMDTGYLPASINPPQAAPFSDALQDEDGGVKLNDKLTWDMCPDIKIDSPKGDSPPFYQIESIACVDYVKFESRLKHRNPKLGHICNIYVQIHNRGIIPVVENVIVKLFYASKSTGGVYPKLPKDFWTSFSPKRERAWKSIGQVRTLPEGAKTLTNAEPTILAWQWGVPPKIGKEVGLLVVVESHQDPIPENHKKIDNIEELVKIERHVGLRTVSTTN